MSDVYLYVDGESHYEGSAKCWRNLQKDQSLETLGARPNLAFSGKTNFPEHPRFSLYHKAHFFWDGMLLRCARALEQYAHRAVYVTSIATDDNGEHSAAVYIRKAGFEPLIVREDRDLAKSHKAALEKQQMLIKGKGVDISLAVRMLEDAQRDLFKTCVLVTSDADYLPLIEAVRRMGKNVAVLGYGEDIAKRNPKFEYVPDQWVDIGRNFMQEWYAVVPAVDGYGKGGPDT
jgi:uncharacterized LabA/DUF88 family protein